jgi:O-antigen ligase
MLYLFFMPIDLSRLFGEHFSIIQTLIKGILTITIIIIYFLYLILNHRIKDYSMYPSHYKLFLLPWVYVIISSISLLWSSDLTESIKSLLGLFSIILLADLVSKKIELNFLLFKSLFIFDLTIVISLLTDVLGFSFARMHFVDAIRYAGITYGAHAIAAVAFIAFLIRVYFIYKHFYSKKQIFVSILMFSLYIYSIQIADSRQILLSMIAISPLWLLSLNKYIFKNYRHYIYLILFFVFILITLFIINNMQGSVFDILQRTGKEDVFTFTGRTYVWESAFKLIEKSPILGYGYGAGGTVLYDFHSIFSKWSTYSAHNMFIHQLLDLGIMGTIVLLLTIIYFFILSKKSNSKLFMSYFIYILLVGFLERSLSGPPTLMYLFFIIFFFYLKQNKFNNKAIT